MSSNLSLIKELTLQGSAVPSTRRNLFLAASVGFLLSKANIADRNLELLGITVTLDVAAGATFVAVLYFAVLLAVTRVATQRLFLSDVFVVREALRARLNELRKIDANLSAAGARNSATAEIETNLAALERDTEEFGKTVDRLKSEEKKPLFWGLVVLEDCLPISFATWVLVDLAQMFSLRSLLVS